MPNIYLDYSLKCINSKPTKGKAPQLEGTFVRREFSLKIEPILFQISNSLQKDNICYATCCPISLLITHLLNEFILVACHSKVCDSTVWNGIDTQFGGFLEDILLL